MKLALSSTLLKRQIALFLEFSEASGFQRSAYKKGYNWISYWTYMVRSMDRFQSGKNAWLIAQALLLQYVKCSEKTLWNHFSNFCWGKLKQDGPNDSNMTLKEKFRKVIIFILFGINLNCFCKIFKSTTKR